MFYDLTSGDRSKIKIPKQPKRRERELRDLMLKSKHPVVLIVDEAHDLHHQTLIGFKRLMELAAGAGVVLSVLLIGHPKLRNDLRRPRWSKSATAPRPSSSRACPAAAASSSPGC